MQQNRIKRVVILSDLHVGSRAGISAYPSNPAQELLLDEWTKTANSWKRPDLLICNGDAIDGKARNDPSQTEPDVGKQVQQAYELLRMFEAKHYALTFGTEFHVSSLTDDSELGIVNLLNANLDAPIAEIQEYYDAISVNGLKLRVRHRISNSTIPYGAATAPFRELIWNIINASLDEETRADIYIFSHTHRHLVIETDMGVALITPCWQARGSKYGSRRCTGRVTHGAFMLEVGGDGVWQMERKLFKIADRWAGQLEV